MTFRDLQDALLEEIAKILKDMITTTADEKRAVGFTGYAHNLPPIQTDEESAEQFFPYFIIRFDTGKTIDDDDCWHVTADIILGVHEMSGNGHEHIITAIQRIVDRFAESPRMGAFRADQDMEWAVEEADTYPYYYGGVAITFSVPKIGRRTANG